MVLPKNKAPWTHTSQRDDRHCDVLERYAYHHPVNNKVLAESAIIDIVN
jgi:hypothetical protein